MVLVHFISKTHQRPTTHHHHHHHPPPPPPPALLGQQQAQLVPTPTPPQMPSIGDGNDVRPTTLPPLPPLEHGAPSGDVNRGAFASKPFEVGEVVAWYDGDLVAGNGKMLEVQTHVLTSGGVGVDGLKVPQEGRGAGSFINDCYHVVGKPQPGGGLFAYNVRCERRLGRFVFIGLLPIAKGDEFFFKYKNRPVAMGWVKYKWVPRQLGPYSTKTEVTCITEGMCPGCRKWAPTRDLEEGLERWWHTECLQRAPPMPPPGREGVAHGEGRQSG